MAYHAKLTFSTDTGNPIVVISFDYRMYNTYIAHAGERQSGKIEGGEFSFMAYSTKIPKVFEFLINETVLDGEIEIKDANKEVLRLIKFEKTLISSFSENFSENNPVSMQFSMIADKVTVSDFMLDFIAQDTA